MLSILWSFLTFIGALILLITVHECGHFLAARCCGVKVERFSIGFGKVIWRHIDSYGTEYVISLIPIGGYVKMLDERIDSISNTFSYQAFNNKTILQRALIITAGSIANFIFAILIYWIVFIHGVSVVRPVIGEILHGSVAEESHILSGMEIKAVDNIATPDWDVVRMVLLSKIGDPNAILTIAKFGENQIQKKQINLYKWHFDPDKQDPVIALGIRPFSPKIDLVIKDIQAKSPAYTAGFQPGDKIIKVNGQLVKQWQDFTVQVHSNPYKKILIEIDRNGKVIELQMVPKAKLTNKMEGFAGITPHIIPFPEEYKLVKRYGVFNAIEASVLKTWQIMKLTASMLGKLIIGDVKLNNLSGPISIAQGARLSAEYGLTYYLMFLALISINLGMLNLFPFPVLDGGHLLFLIIEKIKGGTVSERVQNFSYRIGSILLMLLMGLALFNDFLHLLVSRM